MKRYQFKPKIWMMGLLAMMSIAVNVAVAATVSELRCEYLRNPLGIGEAVPRLSWIIESARRGEMQTAYQIVVNDAWDSGKVASDASVNVEYAGKPLESGRHYTWKVRVWDQDGKPTAWSAKTRWTMGLLKPEDWTAQWISTEVAEPAPVSGGTLKILKATYVAKDGTGSADVTARVAAKVKDGGLSLIVQPDQLGGDPSPNHAKELRVEYEFNGKNLSAAAVDFRTLTLPARTSRVADPLDAPYIRRTFTLDAVPKSTLVTVNVLGFCELYVNGGKVGSDVLSPALSNYHKRSLYVTYDLLPYLRQGRNCIGLWTSRGWYWKVLDGRSNQFTPCACSSV